MQLGTRNKTSTKKIISENHIEHWKTDALYLLRAILMIYSFYLPTFLIMGSIATEKADQSIYSESNGRSIDHAGAGAE